MYLLKEKASNEIIKKYRINYIAKEIGKSISYISIVVHRHRTLPKSTAYAFTKAINSELEIEDLFDRVK